MLIFKTKWFSRFARQQGISDVALQEAIARAERGLVDADLGGGLIKLRIPRKGQGRSGGYRVIVAHRSTDRAFFLYGFSKSRTANIDPTDLATVRDVAAGWLAADDQQIRDAMEAMALQEVLDGSEEA